MFVTEKNSVRLEERGFSFKVEVIFMYRRVYGVLLLHKHFCHVMYINILDFSINILYACLNILCLDHFDCVKDKSYSC